MVLLITYDLKKPGQDYSALYNTIKTASRWWHYLESTWIIETASPPQAWVEKLLPHLDQNDRLIVVQITPNYQGYLPKDAWEWLKNSKY
jgi:hypothetical protein